MKINNEKDYQYTGVVEIRYYTESDCEASGCDQQGICRCSTIEYPEIEFVNSWNLATNILGLDLSDIRNCILTYALDRFLVLNKIYETFNWDIRISGGYYGEEIDGIYLDGDILNDIPKLISYFEILSNAEIVNHILDLENSRSGIKSNFHKVDILEIKRDDLIIKNQNHLMKVDYKMYRAPSWQVGRSDSNGDSSKYQIILKELKKKKKMNKDVFSYRGPLGVCRKDSEGNIILIDGYHRYKASEDVEIVSVIVGE